MELDRGDTQGIRGGTVSTGIGKNVQVRKWRKNTGATGEPSFTWKMAGEMVCVVCKYTQGRRGGTVSMGIGKNVQVRNKWRRNTGATGEPSFTWKMAGEMVCVVCKCS